MNRYRNPRPCVGCNEPLYHEPLLCDICKAKLVLADAVAARNNENGIRLWKISLYVSIPRGLDRCMIDSDETKNAIMSLVPRSGAYYFSDVSQAREGIKPSSMDECEAVNNKRVVRDSGHGQYVRGTVEQIKAVCVILDLMETEIAKAWQLGKEEGNNLLVRLASGDITVDDMNNAVKEEE